MTRTRREQEMLPAPTIEAIRVKLLSGAGQVFVDGILESMRDRRTSRSARLRWFKLYAQCVKLVGGSDQLALMIVQNIGVPLDEARRRVELVGEYEGLDEHEIAARMRAWLRAYDARTGSAAALEAAPPLGFASESGGVSAGTNLLGGLNGGSEESREG